ncbi:MAG: nucleotidyltransferase domain-containing protein [Herbaspirillum sp.]|nr:nucleotidyltransferase domain-containing protein [Herbaspirillum sp.]
MTALADALFSKSTQAVLGQLFLHPEGMHLRALMSSTGLGSASAQRELGKLTSAGLLLKEEMGRVQLYKPNPASPIFSELSAIVRKTFGVADAIRAMLLPFAARIDRAFIYGSVAKGQDTAASDIDLLMVADDLGSADLYAELVALEARLGRKISLKVYRPAEFQKKLAARHHFLMAVMAGPVIDLIGVQDGHQ